MPRANLQDVDLAAVLPLDCSNATALVRLAGVLDDGARASYEDLRRRLEQMVEQGSAPHDEVVHLLRLIFWHAYVNTAVVLALVGRHCAMIGDSPDYEPNQRRTLFQLTDQLFLPVVELMGMWRMRRLLGDRSLQETRQKRYSQAVSLHREVRQRQFPIHNAMREQLWESLGRAGIENVEISEHVSSASRLDWLLRSGRKQGDFARRYAFDLLVPDEEACYLMPLYIHRLWEPSAGGARDGRSFRDFIAVAKFNGYRSLITTVVYRDGGPEERRTQVEFRIRTRTIEQVNLDGLVASLYGNPPSGPIPGAWWFDEELISFVSARPPDSVTPELYVFSPRGKAYRNLPQDSTPIDYAYSVHSDIGNHCKRIWVNGKRASYADRLKNGYVVRIDADPGYQGPERAWLNFVETPNAKSQIRRALQRRRKPRGREIIDTVLDNELQWHGFEIAQGEVQDYLEKTARRLGYLDVNALYLDVADSGLSPERIVNALVTEKLQKHIRPRVDGFELPERIEFARCYHNRYPCRVKPGTPIVGRLVRSGKSSHYLKVYRSDCPNAPVGDEAIELEWLGHREPGDILRVGASAVDRRGLLVDVLSALNEVQEADSLSIIGVHASVARDRSAEMELDIETPDTGSQEQIRSRLEGLKKDGVLDDFRMDPLSPIDRVLLALPDSLPNPYTTGPANWRLFKGREEERQQLAHYLRAQENYILVVGGNRIGKTSLLRYAETHVVPELNMEPITVDMQGLPGQNEDSFWTAVAQSIDDAYSRRLFGAGSDTKGGRSWEFADFMRTLREKKASLTKAPVLLVDETNVVDDLWEEGSARLFVQHLLAFARGYPEINLVLSMQEDLYRRASIEGQLPSAGLLERGVRIRLGNLSEKATRQVITEPVQSMLHYEDGVIEQIVGVTAGHPYYLQRMLERIVERATMEKASHVTSQWLTLTLEQIYRSEHEFHDFLRKTSGFQRPVLVALADACAAGQAGADAPRVARMLEKNGVTAPLTDVRRALEGLYLAAVIQRNEDGAGAVYRIDVPLFQHWLVRTRLASLQARSA